MLHSGVKPEEPDAGLRASSTCFTLHNLCSSVGLAHAIIAVCLFCKNTSFPFAMESVACHNGVSGLIKILQQRSRHLASSLYNSPKAIDHSLLNQFLDQRFLN